MKKIIRFFVPLLLLVFTVASVVWYLFSYDRDFTRDTLLSQARYQDLHGNSRLSAWFYDMAYDFSGHDENVAIELADQYKADGNYTKAEFTLSTAINQSATPELYTALCSVYVEQDKLLDAIALLDKISNPAIKEQLDAARPSAPVSNYEPGFYSQYIDVALSSSSGTLYYTTDGDYPSVEGSVYTGPITLEAGETIIYAVSVDENGLVSPMTVLGYTVTGVIEEVTFTDATMEAEIRSLLGADSDDLIYTNVLWNITEFIVPEGVTAYDDLALLPYLETLTIRNQDLSGLDCLGSLNKLKNLDLTGCRFPADDLSVLTTLPALTHLTLSDCSLSTIRSLENAQNLTCLDLSNNAIRDLSVLTPMTTLTELYLQHNAVDTLSDLSSLSNLQTLDVSYNLLTSLAPIATCVKLQDLEANNNQLSGLDGVDNLPLLASLSVDYNTITDVSLLAACTELKNLSIAENTVTDISALGVLTNLEVFDFSSNQVTAIPTWPLGSALKTIDGSYNQLTSIDALSNLDQLAYIYMDYNLLTNVDALANCFCLVQLNVFGNSISDVSALREHDIIVNYDPT